MLAKVRGFPVEKLHFHKVPRILDNFKLHIFEFTQQAQKYKDRPIPCVSYTGTFDPKSTPFTFAAVGLLVSMTCF